MYIAILLILLGFAGLLLITGFQKQRRDRLTAGLVVGIFTILFFWFMDFWGEMLWFEAIGYPQRFWTVVLAQSGFAVATALLSWLIVYLLIFFLPRSRKFARILPQALGAFIGGVWGYSNWEIFLKYWHRVSTGVSDPILDKDTAFYLFTLPFYDTVYQFLLLISIVSFVALLGALLVKIRGDTIEFQTPQMSSGDYPKIFRSLSICAAVVVFVLAWGEYLSRFHLMYSTWGAVTGAGWTDVHIRLPAYNIMMVLTALLGLIFLIPSLREWFQRLPQRWNLNLERPQLMVFWAMGGVIAALWFIALVALPGIFQWLRVEPNEITFEEPYIAHNIQFTRLGFHLDKVEEKEFPAQEKFTERMIRDNPNIFENIRLWDWRALDAVYKQFQEIRLYYEFVDVDIDRYILSNAYRQVMVSVREMEPDNLPLQSQTFVNTRFKYTHGFGITLTNVSEFTSEGLPKLLIKDIPPQSVYPEIAVDRSQIYYGELSRSHVYVNTREEEFDYPSGEKNVYNYYGGSGGVQLSNVWRNFLFGWKFDGTRFFFSDYPSSESRVIFHRQIRERVKTLAPFLEFDVDPYIVLVDGRLYWIIDAYTTSTYFPYSEPYSSREVIEYETNSLANRLTTTVSQYFEGQNYVRNAVKVVIDAYEGSVDFYVYEPDDPLIQVWNNIFPELFKKREEMPPGLRAHVRYPIDMLLVQGLIYSKYHMTDPAVFYNQEDLWVRATEKYYNNVQPVEPYYVMWEQPGSDQPEFVLILPFTPKNRQVLIGWIAGMCDGDNYGRFLAYKFPKEKRILGPQQVETKIDQDRFLSGQLTLWDQRGSNVIRGNVLAIPVDKTLIYVEPIYLRAETAAYPEMRLVVVMHGDNLSYAETFDQALSGLFEATKRELPAGKEVEVGRISFESLVQDANQAFEDYLRYQGQKQFNEAARALEKLQQTLEQLSKQIGSGNSGVN